MTTEIIDGGALTEREKAVAEYYDNITEEQEEKDRQWAEKNGLLFTGPGALQKAIEVAKARNTANERRMVSFRVPEQVIAGLKRNAAKAGMKYHSYVNEILAAAAK